MTEKHIHNFCGRGPTNPAYLKLWLSIFHNGFFAKVRPSAWRIYCRLLFEADYQTLKCCIDHQTLSNDCGIRRQGIPELIRELHIHRLLSFQRQISRGGKMPNIYYIAEPLQNEKDAPMTTYTGQVIADAPVEITVTPSRKGPAHVRLSRELFDTGFFSNLGKNHSAWKLYCSLLFRADFENGFAFPQITQIMVDCGMARQTVVDSIKYLENVGLIKVQKRKTKKGHIANGYYIWPIAAKIYNAESKKRTSKSLKNGHGEVQISDICTSKNQTSLNVRKIDTNINNQINTTTSLPKKKGEGDFNSTKIEELLTEFYTVNPDRESLPPDQGMNWLTARVKQYGFPLVKYVTTSAKYKDKFTTKLLDGCMQTQHWMNSRSQNKQSEAVSEIIEHRSEPELSIEERIAQKRRLLTSYQIKAERNPGGQMTQHVNRLERELEELENLT